MTPRKKAFILEYLIDLNATQAAIRAGYSEKTAQAKGCGLKKEPAIKKAIQKALDKRAERTQTDADWVVRRLVANDKLAIEEGEIGHSNKALELIGKHHGAFVDRIDTTTSVNVTIIKPDRGDDVS